MGVTPPPDPGVHVHVHDYKKSINITRDEHSEHEKVKFEQRPVQKVHRGPRHLQIRPQEAGWRHQNPVGHCLPVLPLRQARPQLLKCRQAPRPTTATPSASGSTGRSTNPCAGPRWPPWRSTRTDSRWGAVPRGNTPPTSHLCLCTHGRTGRREKPRKNGDFTIFEKTPRTASKNQNHHPRTAFKKTSASQLSPRGFLAGFLCLLFV